jgi:predicted acyltransferase (DUF342 family)
MEKRGALMLQRILAPCLAAAALTVAALPAHAGGDAVSFGSNIQIPPGATVHDAVCFFCSVQNDGEVTGNLVVFFGEVHLAGKADHDVVNFFGTVRAENGASIGNNLVSMVGSVRLGENVSVGRDLVAMFGTLHTADSVIVGNNRVVQPGWILFGPLIFIGFIVTVLVRELRAWRRRQFFLHYPYPPMP